MYNRALSNRLLYTIFLTQSLLSASQIAVFTLIAIVSVRLAGTESVAGLPSSTLTFSQALAAYPMAVVMGRFGRRLGLTIGYGMAALGGLLGVIAVLQGIFPLLLLSAILIGAGRASTDQSRFVAGELFPEAERARMIGRIVFAGTIGAVAGPVLVAPSGRLMESIGVTPDVGPWLAMFVLTTAASLITLFFLRPDPMTVAKTVSDGEATERKTDFVGEARPLRALLMLPQVQLAIVAVLVSQTVMVVLMVMTPLHMDHLHHTRDSISLVISAHTLGMFGLSAVTGYMIDRLGRIRMLLFGSLLLISAAILAPAYSSQYILAVALFLLGLGWNFGYVAGSSLLASTLQGTERAQVQGLNDALVNLAAGFGSIGAGVLFASGGYPLVSVAGLLLTGLLIVLVFWLGRPQLQQAEVEAV